MSARPRRPEHYYTQPTERLPGRPPVRPPRSRRYPPDHRNQRNHGCGTLVLSVFLLVVLLGAGGLLMAYKRMQGYADKIDIEVPVPTVAGETVPDIAKEPFNVLLVGVDLRSSNPTDGARSDTLIVVHVDPINKWASMLSIPRDSYAYIPRLDSYQKINSAYSYGYSHPEIYGPKIEPDAAGLALASETVEQFLNLRGHGTRIHKVAQIDFNGFKQVVDAIGGVTLDVQKPLLDPQYPSDDGDNGYIRLFVPAGLQHMDGTTALRYARSRHADSDFGRSQRQQEVLRAILRSVKSRGLIDQIIAGDQVLSELAESIRTDLPINDPIAAKALAQLAGSLSGDRIISYSINPDVVSVQQEIAGSTIVWSEEDLSRLVAEWLRGPAPVSAEPQGEVVAFNTAHVQVLNGTGIRGLAGQITEYLAAQGFDMLGAGDAAGLYENSRLIDYTDQPEAREKLVQLLRIKNQYISIEPEEGEAPPKPDGADIVLIIGLDYREEWRGAGGN